MTGIQAVVRRASLLPQTGRAWTRHSWFSSLSSLASDPKLVDDTKAPASWTKSAAVVYRDVVTEEQAHSISHEILGTRMRRKRYEQGHWDSVITGYKETELHDVHELAEAMEDGAATPDSSDPMAGVAAVVWALRRHLHENHGKAPRTRWLPCHAIDLKRDGQLSAHVDSVRFSGHMVAGLSLLSPAIMRLREEESSSGAFVDLYLPPKSLYVLTGVGRYDYSHELLPDGATFGGDGKEPIVVTRDQRLSIIFRDAKEEE